MSFHFVRCFVNIRKSVRNMKEMVSRHYVKVTKYFLVINEVVALFVTCFVTRTIAVRCSSRDINEVFGLHDSMFRDFHYYISLASSLNSLISLAVS